MLNNHEVNLTDEEAAAEVARVAKTYPVVRLLSADQIKSEPNCLLAGDRCPCLRQSSLEALAGSDDVSEQLLNDGTEYRARLRPLKVEGEPHVLLMVRPIDEQEAAEEDLVYTDVLTSVRNRRYYEEKLRGARVNAGVAMIDLDDFRAFNDTCGRHAGDLALGAVATAIRSGIRSSCSVPASLAICTGKNSNAPVSVACPINARAASDSAWSTQNESTHTLASTMILRGAPLTGSSPFGDNAHPWLRNRLRPNRDRRIRAT